MIQNFKQDVKTISKLNQIVLHVIHSTSDMYSEPSFFDRLWLRALTQDSLSPHKTCIINVLQNQLHN